MPRSTPSRKTSRSSSRAASPPRNLPQPSRPGLLPDSILESESNWLDFLRETSIPGLEQRLEELRALQDYLRTLGKKVNELEGWLEVTGRNGWAEARISERDPRKDYEMYLFPILKFIEFAQRYRSGNPYSVCLPQLRPSTIHPIRVFTPPASGQLTPAFWEEVFAEDVAILRGFVSKIWHFDHTPFTMDYLERHRGDYPFEVLIQDRAPDSESIKLRSGEKFKMTVKDYISKMRKDIDAGPGTGPVAFAVNIDIGEWQRQIDELQAKVPVCMAFGGADDCLSYIRLHVNGMTLPQIYLKVTGCWTGAHQENLSFTAVNINHGPGVCQWWSLCPEFNVQFREDILRKQRFDPLKSETLWWPDENYLMMQGYKTYYGLQLPDDLVYVGPATLHWVKSLSATVNSAWNFGGKTIRQFAVAFERDALNKEMQFESLVQVHTLAMDLLNREMNRLPVELARFLAGKLQARFETEANEMTLSGLKSSGVFPGHLVRRCEKCKQEVFYSYAACNECSAAYCIHCAMKHQHVLPSCCEMFPQEAFRRLMSRVEGKCNGQREDCYDPVLNLHYDQGQKREIAGAHVSPYKGSPSCIYFDMNSLAVSEQSSSEDEKAQVPKRSRTKEPTSEAKKKRKVTESQGAIVQETPTKRYTRSQARNSTEKPEVDEESKPTIAATAPKGAEETKSAPASPPTKVQEENSAQSQPQSERKSEETAGPVEENLSTVKVMETREIAGTELLLVDLPASPHQMPNTEGAYVIPKKPRKLC